MIGPLSDVLRPKKLDEVVGQKHILGRGKLLSNIINAGDVPNMIFYGPSGVGKTTVANIISERTRKRLHKLNATTASSADIKSIISEIGTFSAPNGILLYLDEIQYFNKKQQQTLLEFIEKGKITLIASTTENPYFCVYGAILSRSTVFEFKPVEAGEIKKAVYNAITKYKEINNIEVDISEKEVDYIVGVSSGDVRKAINFLEVCLLAAKTSEGTKKLTYDMVCQLRGANGLKFDKSGDEHYDTLSAFQKSMRGSDPNASVYYLAKLLEGGALLSACRRLVVCACEDVGLAYPQIIPIVKSAVDIALQVGLPEARIPLADAAILTAIAPKSNSAYMAINNAMEDIRSGKNYVFPRHLQNKHCDGADAEVKGQFYKYAHDFKNHWVEQQYLPDEIKDKVYYEFGENKIELAYKKYWDIAKKANE